MKNSIRRHVVFVVLLAILSVPLTARAEEQNLDKVLARQNLRDGSTLTLNHQDLARPSDAAQARYLPNRKMPFGALTDTAFYLSYLPLRSAIASTVWLTYRSAHFLLPLQTFTGMLITDPNDHPFLIFAESSATETRFSIYKIDLAQHLAAAPLRLNPELREGWPTPSGPLSSVVYKLASRESIELCFVSELNAEFRNQVITVRSERAPSVCGPLTATFDAESNKWTDVRRIDNAEIPVLH